MFDLSRWNALRRLPRRYATLVWVAATFLGLNALVRATLIAAETHADGALPVGLGAILASGFAYDLAAASWVLAPFALLALIVPDGPRGRPLHGVLAGTLAFALLGVAIFTAVAELVFWNEFASRFNFIAVDYLIYTREVVGNVRESYPLGAILGSIGLLALVITWLLRRPFWRAAAGPAGSWRARLAISAALLALPLLSLAVVGDGLRESAQSPAARELGSNGYYEFVRALRDNDLDYQAFYKTLPYAQAQAEVIEEFTEAHSRAHFTRLHHAIEREVPSGGPRKDLNVVLVSIESLGCDYVASFGGRPGLTPNLDRLAQHGMMFTQLYATGLRTVRGLEALSLSVPPTPGHAVLMRKQNKGFQTLGGVLKAQGYEPLYLYGGYSYFDNMQDFFEGNGYTVVDRRAIAKENITHETVWGSPTRISSRRPFARSTRAPLRADACLRTS
jgi:phosphoglycerol transferase MdoB-like AlkP superfamily enzyme